MANRDSDFEDEEVGENIINANKCTDPFTLDGSCSTFECKDGSTAILRHYKVESLSSKLVDWTMDLLERNMSSMYNACSWGWKPDEKKEEMTEEPARYIIAFINEEPVAFSHFRFDMDYGREVVYCYEVQLETRVRTLGLGKHIMKTLENFASQFNLSKIVLTVLKQNMNALQFFKKIGYDIDETSPEPEEEECYEIMSKTVS